MMGLAGFGNALEPFLDRDLDLHASQIRADIAVNTALLRACLRVHFILSAL
jgi:hypothetical protein